MACDPRDIWWDASVDTGLLQTQLKSTSLQSTLLQTILPERPSRKFIYVGGYEFLPVWLNEVVPLPRERHERPSSQQGTAGEITESEPLLNRPVQRRTTVIPLPLSARDFEVKMSREGTPIRGFRVCQGDQLALGT